MRSTMLSDAEIDMMISTSVSWAVGIVRKSHPILARELRDDFCRVWDVSEEAWNDQVDKFIEWVNRLGDTPEISTQQLNEVRF